MKGIVAFFKAFIYTDLIKGLMVTLRHFFKRKVTEQYPKERPHIPDAFRGRLTLLKDEAGEDKCICCMLCVTACPTKVISIKPGKKEERKQRYPVEYNFDMDRCIFCGQCVEACNFGAIELNNEFELAQYSRNDFKLDKEQLYAPTPKVEYKK